jgi:hypothetical protein
MLGSLDPPSDPPSDPPLSPILLDLFFDVGSLPVVIFPAEPQPEFGTSIISMGISNVVTVSSQIDVYVACQSWNISTYLLST